MTKTKAIGIVTAKSEVDKAEVEISNMRIKLGQFIKAKLNNKWVLCQVAHLKYKARTGKDKKKKPFYLGTITPVASLSMPFTPGTEVYNATKRLIQKTLRIHECKKKINIGALIGSKIPVCVDPRAFLKHIAIMGKTGEGKTWTATVIVEELLKFGMTTIIIDPHNDFVCVKDVPEFADKVHVLDPTDWDTSILTLYRKHECVIIPLLEMETDDNREYYIKNLAIELLNSAKKRQTEPFLLFIDEAHLLIPETKKNICKERLIRICKEGRKFGLGVVLLTQRPAKLSKDALSQCDMQIIHKVVNGNDISAISKGLEGISTEDKKRIQKLDTGDALVVGAGLKIPIYVKIKMKLSKDNKPEVVGLGGS